MSTRSIIAQPTADGFAGVFAHWDGYPTVRGAQLWATHLELGSDPAATRAYAVRDGHSGSWSCYLTPRDADHEAQKPDTVLCTLCDATGTRTDGVLPEVPGSCNGCGGTGIAANRAKVPGWVAGDTSWITSDGDAGGTEWAYVIADAALLVFERINDAWLAVAACRWDEPEPDWAVIERGVAADGLPA